MANGCDPEDLLRCLDASARCCTAPVEYIAEAYSGHGDTYVANCTWHLPMIGRPGPLQAVRVDGRWEVAASWVARAELFRPDVVAPVLSRPDVIAVDHEDDWPTMWMHRWLERAVTELAGRRLPADAADRFEQIRARRRAWDAYRRWCFTHDPDNFDDPADMPDVDDDTTVEPVDPPIGDDLVVWLNWILVVPDFSWERLSRRAAIGLLRSPTPGQAMFPTRRQIAKDWASLERGNRRVRAELAAKHAKWRTADGVRFAPGPIPGPDGRAGGAYLHDVASLRPRLERAGAVLHRELERRGVDATMTITDALNWSPDDRWESYSDPLFAPAKLSFAWANGRSIASVTADLVAGCDQVSPFDDDPDWSVLYDDVDGRYRVRFERRLDAHHRALIDARNLMAGGGRAEPSYNHDRNPFDVPDPATFSAAEQILARWCEANVGIVYQRAFADLRPFLVELAVAATTGWRWSRRRPRRLVASIDDDIAAGRRDVLSAPRLTELRKRSGL